MAGPHQTHALLRDRFTWWVCTVFLQRVASRPYRGLVLGAMEYGLRSWVRDQAVGAAGPPDWRPAVAASGQPLPSVPLVGVTVPPADLLHRRADQPDEGQDSGDHRHA